MTAQVLLDAKQALEQRDAALVVRVYTEDAVFEDIPGRETVRGHDALVAYFERLFARPAVAFANISIHESGDLAVLEWTWSGIRRDTGAAYRIRGASVIELADGRIARERVYYDSRGVY